MLSISLLIIILTCLVSITALQRGGDMYKLAMHPYSVKHNRQYYRLLTAGLVHADYMHLGFNMLSLYFFSSVEDIYASVLGNKYYFLVMYVLALLVSNVPSMIKHRDNSSYYALGASGAVSAVIFSAILFSPWSKITLLIIPMPAIVYGVLFLVLSIYLDRRGGTHIAHDAHYWGAIFGLLFPLLIQPAIGLVFLDTLQHGFPGLQYYYGGRRS